MIVNPKTKAVIDSFLDLDTPKGLRPARAADLRMSRPKLYESLKELTEAIYGHPPSEDPGESGVTSTD